MDDSELMNEVLELTLACQRGDATPEEHARLERLLADSPQAILWYLRIVDDTLTLLDSAAAKENVSTATACGADAPAEETAAPENRPAAAPKRLSPRSWMAIMAITCAVLIALTAFHKNLLFTSPQPAPAQIASADSARVVEVSN